MLQIILPVNSAKTPRHFFPAILIPDSLGNAQTPENIVLHRKHI